MIVDRLRWRLALAAMFFGAPVCMVGGVLLLIVAPSAESWWGRPLMFALCAGFVSFVAGVMEWDHQSYLRVKNVRRALR